MLARGPRERRVCRLLCALFPFLVALPTGVAAGVATWTQTAQTSGTIEALLHTTLLGAEHILAGRSGGVRISADSGATWNDLNDGFPASTNVLEFAEGQGAVFAGSNKGVFRRDASWARYGPGPLDAVQVFALLYVPPVVAGSPGILLAGTDNNRVYRSVLNGGEIWTEAGSGMPPATDVNDLALSNGAILAGTPSGVFVSEDGGITWTGRSSGLIGGVNALAVLEADGATSFFAGTGDGMFVSRDEAASWTESPVDPSAVGLLQFHEIRADPDFAGSLYAVVINFTDRRSIYQSSDGGHSWRPIIGGLSVAAMSAAKSVAKLGPGSRELILGSGAGVWRSTLPTLDGVTPAIGVTGTVVTLTGRDFGDPQGTSVVWCTPGVGGTVLTWSDTLITFQAPPGVQSGRVAVARSGGMSNGLRFSLPELVLRDRDSGSPHYTNDVLVAASHVSVGSVDSLRILSGFDVAGWNQGAGALDVWVAAADSSVLEFAPAAEGDTVVAVIEFMVAGSLPLSRMNPAGGPVVLGDTARIVMDLAPPAAARALLTDPTSGDSLVTDSVDVWLHASATGADSVRAAPGSALEFWPLGKLGDWSAYALLYDSLMVRLAAGDGLHAVMIEFADRAGNVAQSAADILLDDTPPAPLDLSLRDLDTGSDEVTDSLVTELRTTAAGAVLVKVAGGDVDSLAGMVIGAWAPYAPARLAYLTASEGEHTVQVQFADSLGNETAPLPVSIAVDLTPPALPDSLYLADLTSDNRSATDSVVVRFRHEGGGADSMRVRSGSGAVGWSEGPLDAWTPYGASASEITLAAAATPVARTVAIELKDLAGNSSADTALITLDLQDPAPSALLARDLSSGTTGRTDSLWVRVVHQAAGADSMRLLAASDDSLWIVAAGAWVEYDDSTTLLLTGGDGMKRIHFEFRDVAGNTARDSLGMLFDGTDPALFFSFHRNPILEAQLVLYLAADETLAAEPLLLEGDVGLALEALPEVEPPLWLARATLPSSGALVFSVAAADLAGNAVQEEFAVGSARVAANEAARLATPDGAAELLLPERALDRELQVAMGRVSESGGGSRIYAFLPDATTFARSATVALRVPDKVEGAGELVIQRQELAGWISLPSASGLRGEAGSESWLSAPTDRMGRFRVARVPVAPGIVIPAAFRLLPNQPDPFRPLTDIVFELPAAGTVRLEVYDVQGRRVAVLVDGEFRPAGRHAVSFHARDAGGAELPSGVYFARLHWGAQEAVEKMVLVR